MPVRNGTGERPIECHVCVLPGNWLQMAEYVQLFIPAVQTFCITDTIPVHVQLCSSLASLRELLPEDSPPDRFGIRLSVFRQVAVEVGGKRCSQTLTLGQGRLWPVSPDEQRRCGPDEVSMDWRGEVRCWKEAQVGGFGTCSLTVKVSYLETYAPRRPLTGAGLSLGVAHACWRPSILFNTAAGVATDTPGDRRMAGSGSCASTGLVNIYIFGGNFGWRFGRR